MTLSGDFPFHLMESVDSPTINLSTPAPTATEIDLVFVQNAVGDCLSFSWQVAEQYGLNPEQLIGKPMTDAFAPVRFDAYMSLVHRVLEYLVPEQLNYPFQCGEQYLVFDLNVSPVLMPQGSASAVVVIGQLLYNASLADALELISTIVYPSLPPSSSRYQKLLTQVAWNIRRTLDLETIWRQTVEDRKSVV